MPILFLIKGDTDQGLEWNIDQSIKEEYCKHFKSKYEKI